MTCFPLGEVPPQAGIGVYFHHAEGVVGLFSLARKGGCKGFIIMAPLFIFEGAPATTLTAIGRVKPKNHQAAGLSNLGPTGPSTLTPSRACPQHHSLVMIFCKSGTVPAEASSTSSRWSKISFQYTSSAAVVSLPYNFCMTLRKQSSPLSS